VTSQARGALAEINQTVAAAAATGTIWAVPVRIAQGKRAEDHFHPSDEGYSLIAADFAAAIAAGERRWCSSRGAHCRHLTAELDDQPVTDDQGPAAATDDRACDLQLPV
jgi:hypothetical protein